MKKLLAGIADFHERVRPAYRETFARLALGQSPDCLFFACSDSRVVPNLFASTDPGDLFVVRNVGNIVPPCEAGGRTRREHAAGAAIEFALLVLGVQDIVICGHSECGAMRALMGDATPEQMPHLQEWLDVGKSSLSRVDDPTLVDTGISPHNRLSQVSVLQQVDNLKTYPAVQQRLAEGRLGIHAWWFDLAQAEVLSFDANAGRFVPVIESAIYSRG